MNLSEHPSSLSMFFELMSFVLKMLYVINIKIDTP